METTSLSHRVILDRQYVAAACSKKRTGKWCPGRARQAQETMSSFCSNHKHNLRVVAFVVVSCIYFIYFAYAMYYRFGDEGSIRLLTITVVGFLIIVYRLVMKYYGRVLTRPFKDIATKWQQVPEEKRIAIKHRVHVTAMTSIGLAISVWILVDVALRHPQNLISAAGLVVFIILFYIFSANPSKVSWRPVILGLYLQFIFALIILRWNVGFHMFQWLGTRVNDFLLYADAGANFMFGSQLVSKHFAFKVFPIIVFFSTIVSMLYYVGVMQFIIRNVARSIAFVMGTSAIESLNASGNIFIGQCEILLIIRDFVEKLTCSELHAVMTGGFATIAGSMLAAYVSFGVPANHLMAASVMSAPAALAMSKLFYPETEHPQTTWDSVRTLQRGHERNILEAASNGASQSIKLISNIAVNIIGFISLLALVNAVLCWLGHRVGLADPELSFEVVCSYIFWPLAFLMGVQVDDCRRVGELIGVKTFINEFVAYSRLSVFIENRKIFVDYTAGRELEIYGNSTAGGNPWVYGNQTWLTARNGDIFLEGTNVSLPGGVLATRSETIATYALCGFSNVASIGVMLGALGAVAPGRKPDISSVVVRAMIAGNFACFMTACVAVVEVFMVKVMEIRQQKYGGVGGSGLAVAGLLLVQEED